jgi:hypothetical protein
MSRPDLSCWAALALSFALLACSKAPSSPPQASAPPTSPSTAVSPDAAPTIAVAPDATIDAPPAPNRWVIAAGRVGAIELGKPLPAELVTGDLGARYAADYVADAQPVDAFRFDEPPVTIYIAGGPFVRAVKGGYNGPPKTDELRAKAVAAVRAGAAVTRVMIHGPGPATAEGFGVGALYPELKATYPKTFAYPRPPSDERKNDDGCVVESSALRGVGWVYKWCKGAEKGEPANRIDLWIPE